MRNILGLSVSAILAAAILAMPSGESKAEETGTRQAVSARTQSNTALFQSSSGEQCNGTSLVSVVAHQDDDILFIDPGITEAARAGGCVTTIYLVGGASGAGFDYVSTRERASQSAYARMMGVDSNWTIDTIVAGGVHLMRATLTARPNVAMVYLRIKGGGVRGGNVPLANLFDAGTTEQSWPYTSQADGPTNTFTRSVLVGTIRALIESASATTVYALNPDAISYEEHPDHIYSARVTREALRNVSLNLNVAYHETYPTGGEVPNVAPSAVQLARDVVGTYFDKEGGGYIGEAAFGEHQYNGNWIARRRFKTAKALDTTPTVSPVPAPIVNMQTQQCLQSMGSGKAPALNGCTGHDDQLWKFVPSSEATGNMGTALLQDWSGNCVAARNNGLVGEPCSSADVAQHWTPWDFGKIFVPDSSGNRGRCLDASAVSMIGDCSRGYPSASLWTRQVTNVGSDLQAETAMVGDVTGDGTMRLVQVHRRGDGPGINIWVSSLSAGSKAIQSAKWYDSPVRFSSSAITPTCTGDKPCYDQTRYLLADFDNDGKADLLAATPGQNGGTAFWLFRSNGNSFAAPVLWAQTSGVFVYDQAQQYLEGDFNGDGKTDVLIAHMRGDSGLNLWVMTNNANAGLNPPQLWASASSLQASARLYKAKLDSSDRTGVIAVDAVNGLRLSTFKSTGSAFASTYGVRQDGLFDPTRSRVLIAKSSNQAFSDVWVLHARADGTAINAWVMRGDATGFSAPVLAQTISAAAWGSLHAYIQNDLQGQTMLLVHRVDAPVGEYSWLTGSMAVKGLRLTTGLDSNVLDYGKSDLFEWTDLAWRSGLGGKNP